MDGLDGGSESLLFKESFLVEEKEGEKRQKVDKNLELGVFLGGEATFVDAFVDMFTTGAAETFLLLEESFPQKN